MDPLGVIHADDLSHFLIAKWSWKWAVYLLNDWGRPGFTVLYGPAAYFGWSACRIFSAVLTGITAWLTYKIASDLRIRAAWVVVPLLYLQPLAFKLAETTLTETPLMLYLTLAIFLAQRGRWSASSAVLSLTFVTRYEAILFLPIWCFVAWRKKVSLLRLWPILWAPIVSSALAACLGATTLFSRLAHPGSSGQYGQGGWLTFFARSMEAWGPGITVLAISGMIPLARRSGLLAASAIVYFAGQTILRALGLYDSGGYARFLVPICPIIAIAALTGWNQLVDRGAENRRWASASIIAAMLLLWISMERQLVLYARGRDIIAELPDINRAKIAIRIATIVICLLGAWAWLSYRRQIVSDTLLPAALVAMIALTAGALCRPLHRPPDLALIDECLTWAQSNGYEGRTILSASVWIDFLQGRDLPPDRPSVREQLARAPVGAIFAWEGQFAGSPDHRIPLADLLSTRSSFRLLHETGPLPFHSDPYLRLFEKIAP
jgi:hypothetical protein